VHNLDQCCWCHPVVLPECLEAGTLEKYISDRSQQFVVEFTMELWRLIRITPVTSTVYHPQTDGQTECINQEMEQFLCIFTNYKQDNWDYLLPTVEFAYNNHIHSLTQQVLFVTDTGWLPRMGFEPNGTHSTNESVNRFCDWIDTVDFQGQSHTHQSQR
jgi:hypothetical protein